ncbi:hypothetical protein V6N11_031243 [Hibiscus sabdariffa]|uniref:Uncharacterized protein n=1 Tax=Hibiscus sabdariffa TaxID=183260 RepID=A0ABR2SXV2_9ROSI
MVVSGSFAGCNGMAWCSFAGRTVVALCSLVGSTMVALCSFVGSTGVALCSFGGSTVVAPIGRAVLPVPLAGRENAGRAWLGCPQHSCATRSPRSDVGLPCALLAWPADWACSTDVVGIMGAGSTLSRPVTVAGAVIGCLAWRPSLFSWCASKLTGAVFLSIACPGVAPFPWPINLVVVEAFFAEGSMGRSLRLGYVFGSTWGLLVVAKGAPLSVLGSLGVRDPGVRAGAFACAYGCFSHGRLVAAGSVSGRPGGAGRSRGRLPSSRRQPCSALAYLPLGCGLSLWPLMAACAVAAHWLGTWLCPLSCLSIG